MEFPQSANVSAPNCIDGEINTGDTTWVLIATVLVLGMMPGLAFFEAGLLRTKNSLSIITQIIAGISTLGVLWHFIGYSLVYGEDHKGIIGGVRNAFYLGVPYDDCSKHAPNIPAAAFAMFQMMFAAITPLLMTGAFAERMRWRAFFPFIILWEVLVYYPLAHWIWGGGWLTPGASYILHVDKSRGVLDFAGGIVIHTSAGAGALVCALVLGPRRGVELVPHHEFPPSNLGLAAVGAAFLWLGWFGFNGGSALTSGALATSTVASTQIAASVSGWVWLMLSWIRDKPSTVAVMNGVIAGLAGVTPASGYINSQWTILLGFILGIGSYYCVILAKHVLHIDDALDVSSVHGFTGVLGSLYIGFASEARLNTIDGADGAFYGSWLQLALQCLGVAVAFVWAGLVTYVLLVILRAIVGIRIGEDEERTGMDIVEHGEYVYHQLFTREAESFRPSEDEVALLHH